MDFKHKPVLIDEVIDLIEPNRRKTVVDCTLGGAGHSLAIQKLLPPDGWLVGVDQDDDALAAARERLQGLENVELRKGNFGDLAEILKDWEMPLDGFLFDLGVSSWQLDNPERGFSYQHDAPLDMRMDRDRGLSAHDIVNTWDEKDLTRIFRDYGEENWSKRVASFIVRDRKKQEVRTTGELVEIIKAAIPAAARRSGGHPGRRIFQALRIAVNAELESLRNGLESAVEMCAPGGVVAVISYHSLEDRIVKHLFRDLASGCQCPKDLPICVCGITPQVKVLTRKPILPTEDEIQENPRARSAKLRAVVKLGSKENRG